MLALTGVLITQLVYYLQRDPSSGYSLVGNPLAACWLVRIRKLDGLVRGLSRLEIPTSVDPRSRIIWRVRTDFRYLGIPRGASCCL